jgi:hypothetical protein
MIKLYIAGKYNGTNIIECLDNNESCYTCKYENEDENNPNCKKCIDGEDGYIGLDKKQPRKRG